MAIVWYIRSNQWTLISDSLCFPFQHGWFVVMDLTWSREMYMSYFCSVPSCCWTKDYSPLTRQDSKMYEVMWQKESVLNRHYWVWCELYIWWFDTNQYWWCSSLGFHGGTFMTPAKQASKQFCSWLAPKNLSMSGSKIWAQGLYNN